MDLSKKSRFHFLMLMGLSVCSVLPFIAFVTLLETISIDFDGAIEEKYKPYETVIDMILISGIIAVPVGFGLGIWGLFSSSPEVRITSRLVSLLLGGLLVLLGMMQYRSIFPAMTIPPSVETLDDKKQ